MQSCSNILVAFTQNPVDETILTIAGCWEYRARNVASETLHHIPLYSLSQTDRRISKSNELSGTGRLKLSKNTRLTFRRHPHTFNPMTYRAVVKYWAMAETENETTFQLISINQKCSLF
jgi:hypothetical protein